jgi:outer membrane translocation and assembly module TamA
LHSTFVTTRLSVQTSVFERFYIVPALSFLLGDGFVTTGSLSDRIAGFDSSIGLTIGMRSPVGPIALNISRAERTSRANVYFSLGYRF